MNRIAATAVGLIALSLCLPVHGEGPGPSQKHLEFLEAFVGQWKVVTTRGEEQVSVGEESSDWMLSKNFMRHVGWGQHEGEHVEYAFCSGWNPKEGRLFQWGFGGNASGYAIIRRMGSYDRSQKVWSSRDSIVFSDSQQQSGRVAIRFVDNGTITIDFTKRERDGDDLPDHHDTFDRGVDVAKPDFDDTPGPGYQHLKFLDFYMGTWKLEGDLPDGTKLVGEESSQWIMNRNFMWSRGWGKIGDRPRVEYEILTGWHPVKQKVVTWGVDSDASLATREGSYNSGRKCLASRQIGVQADGTETSVSVEEQYIDSDSFLLKFTDGIAGGKQQPNVEVSVTRIAP